jgi:hypothetical protein
MLGRFYIGHDFDVPDYFGENCELFVVADVDHRHNSNDQPRSSNVEFSAKQVGFYRHFDK